MGGPGCGSTCQQRPTTEPFSQSQLSHSAIGRSRLSTLLPSRSPEYGTSGSSELHFTDACRLAADDGSPCCGQSFAKDVPLKVNSRRP